MLQVEIDDKSHVTCYNLLHLKIQCFAVIGV